MGSPPCVSVALAILFHAGHAVCRADQVLSQSHRLNLISNAIKTAFSPGAPLLPLPWPGRMLGMVGNGIKRRTVGTY